MQVMERESIPPLYVCGGCGHQWKDGEPETTPQVRDQFDILRDRIRDEPNPERLCDMALGLADDLEVARKQLGKLAAKWYGRASENVMNERAFRAYNHCAGNLTDALDWVDTRIFVRCKP